MNKLIIAGSGTGVGKTIVSAILTTFLEGDYWKPIQCGCEKDADTAIIKSLVDMAKHHIYPPVYSLKAPLSPHHAARLESTTINLDTIIPPQTTRPLIIEGVGGIFVPLTTNILSFDLFKTWESRWVVVSKHYLGSINHTLLTIDILKQHRIPIAGIIFNGKPNPDSEAAILEISNLPFLGRLLPEKNINLQTIQKYAKQWKPLLSKHLL